MVSKFANWALSMKSTKYMPLNNDIIHMHLASLLLHFFLLIPTYLPYSEKPLQKCSTWRKRQQEKKAACVSEPASPSQKGTLYPGAPSDSEGDFG
jgi:hypothetical protein